MMRVARQTKWIFSADERSQTRRATQKQTARYARNAARRYATIQTRRPRSASPDTASRDADNFSATGSALTSPRLEDDTAPRLTSSVPAPRLQTFSQTDKDSRERDTAMEACFMLAQRKPDACQPPEKR